MKILMVSIFAPHFFNWAEQLKDSAHEVYWLDVFDSNTKVKKIEFATQIIGWRYRIDYPGRYAVKKRLPAFNRYINSFNERDFCNVLDQKIKEIQPEVVHSFVMYLGTAPILKVIKKYSLIKWIYSSWGSDLYFYQNIAENKKDMLLTFPHLDFMFSDCKRDYQIAIENGFRGEFLGVFPGGGGLDFSNLNQLIVPVENRKTILIKGYQGKHGKCIEVLAALKLIDVWEKFNIVVFGATSEVINFTNEEGYSYKENFKIFKKVSNEKVLQLMGESLIYIGNSTSDGMPNTLLEAIVMGAFPVQSNPGGATEELIIDGKNGILIKEPENIEMIARDLSKVFNGGVNIQKGISYNFKYIRPSLEREFVRKEVLKKYKLVEKSLI